MKLKRVLVWGIGLVLVLLAAGGTYLSLYLDQNKGLLESGISAALEVRIEKGGNELLHNNPEYQRLVSDLEGDIRAKNY